MWLVMAFLAARLPSPWSLAVGVALVAAPAVSAAWFLGHCGGRTQTDAPCQRLRRGFTKRCHDHRELLTGYDLWGAFFLVLALVAVWVDLRYVW